MKDVVWKDRFKKWPTLCCPQEISSDPKTQEIASEGVERYFTQVLNIRELLVAVTISDKTEFKSKTVRRNKDQHYILIKILIHHKTITTVNIYIANNKAPKYMKN